MPKRSPGPASRSYFSNRLRLHYVDWGNEGAPPLLLVHGGRDQWRYLERQSERHGVCDDWRRYEHTRITMPLDKALARAHQLGAFMPDIPYKRYER